MNSLLHGLGLFETIRVSRGIPEFLDRHAERMARSAQFLGISFSEKEFINALGEALADCSPDLDWRVRITLFLDEGPHYLAQAEPLGPVPEIVELMLSDHRVFSGDPLCQHKTTSRLLYYLIQREAEARGLWDGFLLNERGEVTETGRANLFFMVEDEILTPPVSSGVLPGIIREILLEHGLAREEIILPDDINRASAAFVTNSLIRAAGVCRIRGMEYEPDPSAIEEGLREIGKTLDAE